MQTYLQKCPRVVGGDIQQDKGKRVADSIGEAVWRKSGQSGPGRA
jgi:hypothetical protein